MMAASDWTVYRNRQDRDDRMRARWTEAGYEARTMEGAEVGMMPRDVLESIYEEDHGE